MVGFWMQSFHFGKDEKLNANIFELKQGCVWLVEKLNANIFELKQTVRLSKDVFGSWSINSFQN